MNTKHTTPVDCPGIGKKKRQPWRSRGLCSLGYKDATAFVSCGQKTHLPLTYEAQSIGHRSDRGLHTKTIHAGGGGREVNSGRTEGLHTLVDYLASPCQSVPNGCVQILAHVWATRSVGNRLDIPRGYTRSSSFARGLLCFIAFHFSAGLRHQSRRVDHGRTR